MQPTSGSTTTTQSGRRPARLLRALAAVATLGASLVGVATLRGVSSAAPISFSETFAATVLSDTANWVLTTGAGSRPPCLTAATAPVPLANATSIGPCPSPYVADATGSGVLRLTDTGTFQGGALQYTAPQSTADGLDITFSLAQWGGTGANGISFFLKDGANTSYDLGGFGAALGYGNKPTNVSTYGTGNNGIPGALLGIGFDVNGAFAWDYIKAGGAGASCATPGTTTRANSITIRGGDTSTAKDGSLGFCYLAGTAAGGDAGKPVSYAGADRAAAKRQVRIVIDPNTASSPKVRVYLAPDAASPVPTTPTIETDQPAELKSATTFNFGFAAASGGATNNHEIGELGITPAPTTTTSTTTTAPAEPTTWCTLPYLAQGASTTIGGITITATTNTASSWTTTNLGEYLFLPGNTMAWSFSPGANSLKITPSYNGDSLISAPETFTYTGKAGATTVVNDAVTDTTTKTYLPSTALDTFQTDFATTDPVGKSVLRVQFGIAGTSCEPAPTTSTTSTTSTTAATTTTTVGSTTTTTAGATTTTVAGATTSTSPATTTSTTAAPTTSTLPATTTTGTVLVTPFTTTTTPAGGAAVTTTSLPPAVPTTAAPAITPAPAVPVSVLGAQVSAGAASTGARAIPGTGLAFTGSSTLDQVLTALSVILLALVALALSRVELRRRAATNQES